MKFVWILALFVSCCTALAFEMPKESSQCVLGITEGWNSSHVTLSFYEKKNGIWVKQGDDWKGRLGSKGAVWGRGLHPNPPRATLKKEGDGRSPTGVFDLGGVWGSHRSIQKHPKMFYHQVNSRDLWVEDGSSEYYNQFLILKHEPETPWEKKAQMVQNDYPHSLKLYIAHNSPPKAVPYGGSSIFFHIWRNGGTSATAGCTTMIEERLRQLIAKIDPSRRPLYVLLPRNEYLNLKPLWKLP